VPSPCTGRARLRVRAPALDAQLPAQFIKCPIRSPCLRRRECESPILIGFGRGRRLVAKIRGHVADAIAGSSAGVRWSCGRWTSWAGAAG
jgi:hypothetical protein